MSSSIFCTRKISFDAAHRIMHHESKCRFLHGHRYDVEATFTSEHLDSLGRIVDFGVIYQLLGKWIDENWDHSTILYQDDTDLGESITAITDQTIIYLPCNPTAENMAYYLLYEVCPSLFHSSNFKCIKIRLYETPNCYAEVLLK